MSQDKSEKRKYEHLELTNSSQVGKDKKDMRFYYEPLLANHPDDEAILPTKFLGFELGAPLWVSSMTGGTQNANKINLNLAKACHKFRLGMGLGSCRPLLQDDAHFDDFNLRPIIGDDLPFFANLGIAQVEELIEKNEIDRINRMVERLKATGLVIHINPLQEWLQPEGDRFKNPPLETIKLLLSKLDYPLILKEVGQGFGPKSLELAMGLPLAAIELAGFGGTNFSKLELLRQSLDTEKYKVKEEFSYQGHDAFEMVNFINKVLSTHGNHVQCKEIIISGGIKSFLDGHFLMNKLDCPSVYGQAAKLLDVAKISYERLDVYLTEQIIGLKMAKNFLVAR
jgi:isopentenyl-diphosphate delta-isomerase